MPITFLQLKQGMRSRVFPAGEARNLRVAHDKSVVDCLVDLQRWVECLQSNNTHLVPHCATYYKCGLTLFDFPRAIIKRLSVIDKINPTTNQEDASVADDYCTEIEYDQVDPCTIRGYLSRGNTGGCCWPIHLFFAIPQALCGGKSSVPIPTDVGVPAGLPQLRLGQHYPQTSTDGVKRAMKGVWAVESGQVWVAPWIQSTETIVLRWEGIKRDWQDLDLIDDDPELIRAVDEYVRWDHYAHWDKRPDMAAAAYQAYGIALQQLMYDCEQENRVRECEPIKARGIAPRVQLFFNDDQQAVASCQPNQTGQTVTVQIPAGTVASTVSKADANQKAIEEARSQARAQLDCTDNQTVYTNTAQTATASCTQSPDSPAPDGQPVTRTVAAGLYSSTVSQDEANALALAAAQSEAQAALSCTYWNSEKSYTAVCNSNSSLNVTKTVLAHTFSSPLSQEAANQLAYDEAKRQADEAIAGSCPDTPEVFESTEQVVPVSRFCVRRVGVFTQPCAFNITVLVAPGYSTSTVSQLAANADAQSKGALRGNQYADQICQFLQSGAVECRDYNITLP